MKKYILSLAIPVLALMMGGCSKDTEDTTWVTYYPQMTMKGDTYMNWEAGKAFQDPGVTIVMNNEDVTDQMVLSTQMNLSDPQPGFYTLTYGFTNPDGIVANSTRYVAVYSAEDPIAGYYATDPESNRSGTAFAVGQFFPIKVQATNGGYAVNDLLGGYYDLGRGYGSNYALPGVLSVDGNGTVNLESWSPCPGWPDNGVESFEPGSYDATTKTLHWTVGYAGTPFDVYVTKL